MHKFALQCGCEAPFLYEDGNWNSDREDEWDFREYDRESRESQLRHLEGYGTPPSLEELKALPWPLCNWWEDRDRIVLLHEFIEAWPPMGHRVWEQHVLERAVILWQLDFMIDSEEEDAEPDLLEKSLWDGQLAPGYRLLTSFPCCPRLLRVPQGKLSHP